MKKILVFLFSFLSIVSSFFISKTSAQMATSKDWIGLYQVGTPDSPRPTTWKYVNCSTTSTTPANSGSCSFTVPSGAQAGDYYEFRLFANDTFTKLATSNRIGITAGSPGGAVGNCDVSTKNEGLISAHSKSQRVGNLSATCVLDTSATDTSASYREYKVPTYQDLEDQYYNLSSSTSKKAKNALTPSSPNWNFSGAFSGNGIYLQIPTQTQTVTSVVGTGTQVIFIEGNLYINGSINYPSSGNDADSGLVFITSGDIYIDSAVTNINAVLISAGTICTAYIGTPGSGGACSNGSIVTPSALTVNGSLISIAKTEPSNAIGQGTIYFRRNLGNALNLTTPAEIINKQDKYLYNLKSGLFTKDLIVITEDQTAQF